MDTRSLYQLIQDISRNYYESFKELQIRKVKIDDSDEVAFEFIQAVNNAFDRLDEEDRKIIENEFFFGAYQGWWKNYYSRAYFYTLKKKAALLFRKYLSVNV